MNYCIVFLTFRDHDSPPYDDRDSSRKPCLFKKLDEDSRSKKVKQAVTARSSTSSNRHAYDSSDEETKSPTTEENLPTKSHKDSSESSSGDSEDEAESEEDVHPLTEKELNELNAKILRAELMGNEVRYFPILGLQWRHQKLKLTNFFLNFSMI